MSESQAAVAVLGNNAAIETADDLPFFSQEIFAECFGTNSQILIEHLLRGEAGETSQFLRDALTFCCL